MAPKVGIPEALLYYLYYPFWKTYLTELGMEVVTSGRTSKETLDAGVREALADACVPVKLFFGHCIALRDRVDYLFIPRVVCLNGETTYCPKFLGLPDMIKHGICDMPPVIDIRIDSREGFWAVFNAYARMGQIMGSNRLTLIRAFYHASAAQREFEHLLTRGLQPKEAMDIISGKGNKTAARQQRDLVFAVLGYPYNIHDEFISVGLLQKLAKLNIKVLTAENLYPGELNRINHTMDKRLFWTLGEKALRAAHLFFKRKSVDGIIHLTAFGCGPDSIVNNLINKTSRQYTGIPFMSVTIDEHSGEAGLATRLEAFVDMVRRRKEAFNHA